MHSFTKPFAALLTALALPLLAPSGAQAQHLSVQEVPLTTNHVVYDSFNGKVYASIPGTAALNPNTVARIDATTRTVEAYIPVGSEPDVLALSSDGQYLYVGIDGVSGVARIKLATNSVDQQFSLPTSPLAPQYPYHAGNIVPLPGLPQSVAVTRDYFGISPANDGVAIYDNGVQRINSLSRGANIYASLTGSNSPNRLYSYDNESSAYTFAQLNADTNGLTVGQTSNSFGTGILAGYNILIKFDKGNGYVYATNGKVIDPVALTDIGTCSLPAALNSYPVYVVDVVPDSSNNRIFFLAGPIKGGYSGSATIATYNQSTFQPTSSNTTLAVYASASDLYEISPTKFMFRSDQGVEFASPQTLTSITVTAAATTIAAGKTDQFTATASYPDGTTSDVTGSAAWSSSNINIATISSTGLAQGGTSGTTNITAALNGTTSSPVALTVTPAHYQVLWDNADGRASVWNYNADNGTYTHQEYGPYAGWTAKAIAQGGADGRTRVLWNNTDGRASLWMLDNPAGTFTPYIYGPYAGWTATSLSVNGGNMNAPLAGNTNTLLWNNIDGSTSVWSQSPDAFGSFTPVTNNPSAGWTARAVADNPEGQTLVLQDNADGRMVLGYAGFPLGTLPLNALGPYPGWTANAVSVAADGTDHILWNNTDGRLSLWNYSFGSTTFTHNEYGPFAGWTASALADGSDGKTLVLWNNTNGSASLWSLNNVAGVYTHAEFGPFAGWTAKGVSGN